MRDGDQVETLLIDEWLGGLDSNATLPILDQASVSLVRQRIRELDAPKNAIDRACLVASEIGTNQLRHAHAGYVALRSIERDGAKGIEITGVDRGSGIEDVGAALDASLRREGSLGVGIGSIRRLSSEVDFDIRMTEGTRIVARVFDDDDSLPVPRRREIGIYGRPFPGERTSGDHASFHRTTRELVVGVCDGLGHGAPARVASVAAVNVFDQRPSAAIDETMHVIHQALPGTRGVVMALARLSEDEGTLETCSVGNIDGQICGPRKAKRISGTSAVLGARSAGPLKPRVERMAFPREELFLLASDGISSRVSIEEDLDLLRMHPIAIAEHIVRQFGRATDDALVLVVR